MTQQSEIIVTLSAELLGHLRGLAVVLEVPVRVAGRRNRLRHDRNDRPQRRPLRPPAS